MPWCHFINVVIRHNERFENAESKYPCLHYTVLSFMSLRTSLFLSLSFELVTRGG